MNEPPPPEPGVLTSLLTHGRLNAYAGPFNLALGALALLVVAVLVPVMNGGYSGTVPSVTLFLGIYIVLALGLNVVVGFTGLLDLGYVTFLATGAVVTAFLTTLTHTETGIDWPIGKTSAVVGEQVLGFDGSILLIMLAAGLLCAVLGVLRGIPTLRVRGDYYAIVTLGFAEIVYETFLWDESNFVNFTRVTGGAFGVKLSTAFRPTLFGEKLYYATPHFYYLVLAVVVLTFLVTHHVNRSRVGRALAAIRLDETAARACGVNVSRYKLIAFAVSGFIGGVGGSLYALWSGTVAVKGLDVWQSVLILCGVVLGGMGSIRGAALGTAMLMGLGELLREDVAVAFDLPWWGHVLVYLLLLVGVYRFKGAGRLVAIGGIVAFLLGSLVFLDDLRGFGIPAEARFLIYGLLLIILMRFRPQGILPPVRHGTRVTDEERAGLMHGPARLFALDVAAAPADTATEGEAAA